MRGCRLDDRASSAVGLDIRSFAASHQDITVSFFSFVIHSVLLKLCMCVFLTKNKRTTTIRNCFYVDDCLASAPTEKEATALLHKISKLLSTGGFKITKWTSNSRKVIKSVPPQERSKELKDLNLSRDPLPKEHSLGLRWDVETDTLCFKVKLNDKPTVWHAERFCPS